MDFELKFLVAFYAIIATLVSTGCVIMLITGQIAALLPVFVALIAGIAVLVAGVAGTSSSDR